MDCPLFSGKSFVLSLSSLVSFATRRYRFESPTPIARGISEIIQWVLMAIFIETKDLGNRPVVFLCFCVFHFSRYGSCDR